MEMHQEWGTREEMGWGDEKDGRWVGDTGCDEAVDLICSPTPSFSASLSVTYVLSCLLHLPFPSFFFVSPHFIFFFIMFFHFIQFLYTFSFLSLSILLFFLLTLLFLFLASVHHLQNTRYSFTLCIFLLGFLADTLCTLSLYMHKHLTLSSFAPLPPTAAASLLGSLHLCALQ